MAQGQKLKWPWQLKLVFFLLIVAGIVFAPTTLIIAAGMVPTLVAVFVDRVPGGTAGATVGAMNFAGTLPFVFKLWHSGHSFENALAILSDPVVWMIMYAAAMAGWIIYDNVTPFVASMIVRRLEKRGQDIEARLKELRQLWGDEVMQ